MANNNSATASSSTEKQRNAGKSQDDALSQTKVGSNPQKGTQDVLSSKSKRKFSQHVGPTSDSVPPESKYRRTIPGPSSAPGIASETSAVRRKFAQQLSLDEPPSKDYSTIPPKPDSGSNNNRFSDIIGNNKGLTTTNHVQIKDLLSKNNHQDDHSIKYPERLRKALKYPLYSHQKIAVNWMAEMESNEQKLGGILADDMGLGKTLSTIGLILSRRAKASTPGAKTNLIVAPLSLLKQWQREIDEKILPDYKLRVFIQHTKKISFNELSSYDVVLTSYGLIGSEYKKLALYTAECEEKTVEIDKEHLSKMCPILGPKSWFFRVILDEAQCIKNAKTNCAKGASRLKAKFRWCLTGTPMQNGPKELASLIHFLRIQPYCDLKLYEDTFKCLDPKNVSGISEYAMSSAVKQLQALISAMCLRRNKNSMIDGKPIIELKGKTEIIDHVVFDENEQRYYNSLEQKTRAEYGRYQVSGTIGMNYARILVMLLRLRQACCHPYLHFAHLEFINPDINVNESLIPYAKTLQPDLVTRIKEANAFECSSCHNAMENPFIIHPCGDYFCAACVERFMDQSNQKSIRNGNESGNTKKSCPVCQRHSTFKFISYDDFKKVHMPEEINIHDYEVSDTDDGDEENDNHGSLKDFVVDDDVEDGKAKSKTKPKAKVDELQPYLLDQLRKKAAQSLEAHKVYMRFLRKTWMPSTKVTKCCQLISEIQIKSQEKIIVFSQWTLLLDFLEVAIGDQLNMKACRYDGSMSTVKRDNAISEFTNNPDLKVILVSLRSGNAGLNLTAASQVIIMDPFWNPYVENQAIDRTYRIGQHRDVTVHRILIQERTIEDRIIKLQNKKREMIESALDEESVKDIGRLDSNGLTFLFGFDQKSDQK
ncbi:SNF2 family N-terminal domain-containing protein [Jackrogersella minutella]|nr:SNF2 family N-terminal domain-containing protein [Jackrogersella minutella]